MAPLRRFLIILSFLLITGLLLFVVFKNSYFYLVITVCLFLSFLLTYILIVKSVKSWPVRLVHSFFSPLLLGSGVFYLVFVEDSLIKVIIAVLASALFLVYLNKLENQFFSQSPRPAEQQNQLLIFLETVASFFIAAGFFGLRDFLNISIGWLALFFFVIFAVLIQYCFFYQDKPKLNRLLYNLVITLILLQLFWATAILPLVYYLKGLIISFFYLIIMESVIGTSASLSKKAIRNYLIVFLIVLLALLYTSRWF